MLSQKPLMSISSSKGETLSATISVESSVSPYDLLGKLHLVLDHVYKS